MLSYNILNIQIIILRWYGNVGRFLNHSCDPNLEKVNVFLDIHDVRLPRYFYSISINFIIINFNFSNCFNLFNKIIDI